MRTFLTTALKALAAVSAAGFMDGMAFAQQLSSPPPDAAAHTVIVPFDPGKPLTEQKADRFYLDYATFQGLWSKAKENRRPEKPEEDAGSGVAVNLAMHDVEVKDVSLTIKSRFQIGSRGDWQSVSLPVGVGGSGGTEWMLDGQVAPMKDGRVLLEKSGAHQVDALGTAGLARGWQEVALKIPSAEVSLLRIAVPLTDGLPDVTPAKQISLVAEEVREGRRIFTFVLNQRPDGELKLKRQPARRAVDQAAAMVCDIRTDLTVRTKTDEVHARLNFSFPGVERSAFAVVMDEDLRPVSWNISGLKDVILRREGGRLVAEIRLTKPVRDAFSFTFLALRPRDAMEGERKAPFMGAQAGRVERVIQVHAPPVVKVGISPGGAMRIATGSPVGAGSEPSIGAWRLRGDDSLSYTVVLADDTVSAQMEMLAQVGSSKLEIMVAATLKAGRLPLRETYLRLPQGYEVQSVQGAGIRGWQRDEAGVFVQFDASVSNEARLILNAATTRAPGESAASLPVVFFDGMAKQKAAVLVAVNAAMDVRMQLDRAWRETDPAALRTVFTVSPPWLTKRALLWETEVTASKQPPPAPQVTLILQPPKFSADTVLLVRSSDEILGFSQQVGIAVEQGAVAGVKVRLPASLPEARVGGPDVRDVQITTQDDIREYSVTFQGEILGSASVTLDWEQTPGPEAVLPLTVVEGASRSRRFFIVENNSSREMKTALTNVDKTVATAVPWLPEGLATADLYQARSADAEMKLTFSNTQATAGNAAIITLAEITTALRPNGERWETVVYSLANRSLQFLPVRLPKGAELVTVMVGDEMVRADWGTPSAVVGEKAQPCHLVPLIKMRAGQLSQEVRLTYFVPAKEGSIFEDATLMDDPELAGLSAERTLWNVWVPEGYELDEFDGNMEEVVEEVMEDEKVQQKLSDVLRLNRIVSLSSTSEDDAKEALDNASKALKEVTQYQESKKKSRSYRSTESKPTTKGKVQGKAMDEEVRLKSNQQVEQQLRQQNDLLTANTGKLGKFSKTGSGTLQLQGALGALREQAQGAVNTWSFNKSAAEGKTKEEKVVLEGANTVLNDNVAVSNDFLMQQGGRAQVGAEAAQIPQSPQLPQMAAQPQQAQELTANITLNNARGAANFAQGAEGAEGLSGDGRVTAGQPGVTTSNRYTRTLTISGGTLTPPLPLPSAPAPAGMDPFAPAAAGRPGITALSPPPPAPVPPEKPVDPNRFQPALSPPHVQRVRDVATGLQSAYSYYNLGDFDNADAAFQEVLRMDPYNRAARRGMERTAQMRSDYHATAGDHTRARMLNEVNRGWEDPVPVALVTPQLKPQGRVSMPVDVPLTGTVYHFRKLKDHAALELDIDKPLEAERKMALWLLLGGGLALTGVALLSRKRDASKEQGAYEPG